jgi:single-strand DNA-binding protein
MNKTHIIGHLGQDVEIRTLESGNTVASFTVASSENYTNKQGEKVTNTEWFRIEMWNKQAEIAGKYLKKGSHVYIEGKQKTDTWTNKEGEKRSSAKIQASLMKMLGSKDGARQEPGRAQAEPQQSNSQGSAQGNQEDEVGHLPF